MGLEQTQKYLYGWADFPCIRTCFLCFCLYKQSCPCCDGPTDGFWTIRAVGRRAGRDDLAQRVVKHLLDYAIVPHTHHLMLHTVIDSQTQRSAQSDLMGNPVEVTALRARKKPQQFDYSLTHRGLQLLTAIHNFGNVLTTLQFSTLFWPPDVGRRLAGWGVPGDQIAAWLADYPAAYLVQKVEQLKWGLRVNRVREKVKRSKADGKLIEWIAGLEPLLQEELWYWLDGLASAGVQLWLTQAVLEDRPVPHAFTIRPRLPSEAVSSACKHRLRYLAGIDLIELHEQPTRLSEGRAQSCWFLTREGRNVLARARGVKPDTLDWKRRGAYGAHFLAHRLAINEFRIGMELACRQRGYRIRRWLDDNQLKRMLAQEKVTLIRGVRGSRTGELEHVEEEHSLKIPDGFFWLDMGCTLCYPSPRPTVTHVSGLNIGSLVGIPPSAG